VTADAVGVGSAKFSDADPRAGAGVAVVVAGAAVAGVTS
jgi:hypothetical protein